MARAACAEERDAELRDAPWAEQLAPTTRPTASSSPTCCERSPFYRDKLAGRRRRRDGGLADIGALPLTEKQELRATVTPREPVRRAPLRGAATRSSASTPPAARPARRATSR